MAASAPSVMVVSASSRAQYIRLDSEDVSNAGPRSRAVDGAICGSLSRRTDRLPTCGRAFGRGKEDWPKMTTDIFRVGIVGCGLIADKLDDVPRLATGRIALPWTHAPAYAMVPDTKIVAAADVNESVVKQFAQRWEVPAVYTDYREMLHRENLDVVSVLVPNFLHCDVTLEAAAAGVKVVVCEVPMTASVEEADRMIRACEEAGTELVVDIGSGRRWAQEYLNAREIIETGEIGDLVTMTATVTGGLLLNGTSLIDMLRFFAGSEVTEVLGWLYDPPSADSEYVDRGASGFMRFENGVEAIFSGRDEKPFVEWDIMGSRGPHSHRQQRTGAPQEERRRASRDGILSLPATLHGQVPPRRDGRGGGCVPSRGTRQHLQRCRRQGGYGDSDGFLRIQRDRRMG